jgi:ABC-type spermidine/putrescine transport system permease subunit I
VTASTAAEEIPPHNTKALSNRTSRGLGLIAVAPAMVLVVTLFAFPLGRLIVQSFSQPTWNIGNYTDVLTDPTTWRIMKITFMIALESTGLCLLLGYPLAFAIASLPPDRARLVLAVVLFPFWTSILARMYAWEILLSQNGAVVSALQHVGVNQHPNLLYNRVSVLLGMTHYLLPFMVLALYSTMVTIDRSLSEASSSLGASSLHTFLRVYFPLSLPGVFTGSLLVFILALGFYVTPATLGGPRDTTIAIYIQQRVNELEFGQATAMAVVLLLIVSILFFVYDRYLGFERLLRRVG